MRQTITSSEGKVIERRKLEGGQIQLLGARSVRQVCWPPMTTERLGSPLRRPNPIELRCLCSSALSCGPWGNIGHTAEEEPVKKASAFKQPTLASALRVNSVSHSRRHVS